MRSDLLFAGALAAHCSASGCGAGVELSGSAVDSSGTEHGSTTPAAEATGAHEGCWRDIPGDLTIDDDTDLDSLRDVVSVGGLIKVDFRTHAVADLSFLGCLESADRVNVGGSAGPISTRGMDRLATLRRLTISGDGVEVAEGFDSLLELETLWFHTVPKLRDVKFPNLERATYLIYGPCGVGTQLESTGRFDSLARVDSFTLDSNSRLVDETVLDALAENGAPRLQEFEIILNPKLSTAQLAEKLMLLGNGVAAPYYNFCGNLEPFDDYPCICVVGD